MRPEDFFVTTQLNNPLAPTEVGLFGSATDGDPFAFSPSPQFDLELLRGIRAGTASNTDDVEAGSALARLAHDELEAFGTSGDEQLSESEMRECLVALRAVLARLGMSEFDVPFRDYRTFKSYWLRNDGYGSWQARRDLLSEIFDPIHNELADREAEALTPQLATAVSPRGRTGWLRIDVEIAELRRHFAQAKTPQDYRNVGNDCVNVLEALSRQAYDTNRHLREGEDEPPVAKTKIRLDRVVEDELPGKPNEELRRQIKATIDLAQAVKHRSDGDRKSAGVAADSVILVANLLRRVVPDERE